MTDAQVKALFAKQETLRRSVQGMKTQQGYLRDDVRKVEGRVDPLERAVAPLPKQLDDLRFGNLVLLVSVALFYGTLILGWVMR